MKYAYVVHAEANAVAYAAKWGISIDKTTAVLSLFSCANCTKLLIQSGVAAIVAPEPDMQSPKWKEDFVLAQELLQEAGIKVHCT